MPNPLLLQWNALHFIICISNKLFTHSHSIPIYSIPSKATLIQKKMLVSENFQPKLASQWCVSTCILQNMQNSSHKHVGLLIWVNYTSSITEMYALRLLCHTNLDKIVRASHDNDPVINICKLERQITEIISRRVKIGKQKRHGKNI